MIPMRRLVALLPLLLIVALGCSGSSGNSAKVSGKVMYNGKAVPAGSIGFHAPEGGFYNYSLKEDGSYSGTDLPTGVELVVTVETESANPKGHEAVYGGKGKEGGDPNDYKAKMEKMGKIPSGPSNAGPYVPIPKQYADKKSSPLKVTLKSGSNEFSPELKD
jgi:hypothetical protein